jgi:Zn-finger protein
MESAMVPEGIDKNKFFQHTECDYFPCHEGIPVERFNCMLCYCPLYTLGEACGGNYTYTSKGAKNCKACNIPHNGDSGVLLVRERFGELVKLAAKE